MTPITHKIEETGIELCIVGLPEVDMAWIPNAYSNELFYQEVNKNSANSTQLPDGLPWTLLSLLSEITEEKLQGIIDPSVEILDWAVNSDAPNVNELSRVDVLNRILQSLEVYTVNPYAIAYQFDQCRAYQYYEAQQRVIKDAAVLFRKID